MRHIYAYRITYIIGLLLVGAAVLFALIQSEDIALVADEPDERHAEIDPDDIDEIEDPGDFDWQALGEEVYIAECSACHGTHGEGEPGLYPPLAGGHAAELLKAEGGRDYLIDVILYGLEGEITIQGETYDEPMPPMPHLDDVEIAATLNFMLTAWNNEEAPPDDADLYVPADVTERRDEGLSPSDVHERRPGFP